MKAIILAAGKGTRMLPLTKYTPKVLIEIRGKPFLWYLLDNLKKAGYTEFGIVVGYLKEKVREFVNKYHINATLIEQKEQRGTGHAALQAEKFVAGENFVLLAGDHLWSARDLRAVQKHDAYCYVSGLRVKDPSPYGVLVTEGEFVVKIVEKPKTFVGDLINVSLYKFTPEIFKALHAITPTERGELEVTDAVSALAGKRRVKVNIIHDYWLDLGTKEDIGKIEEFLVQQTLPS